MTEIGGLGYLGAVPGKSAGFKGIATATNLLQVKPHWHPTAAHAVLHVKALTLANPLPFHFSGLAPPDTLTTLTAQVLTLMCWTYLHESVPTWNHLTVLSGWVTRVFFVFLATSLLHAHLFFHLFFTAGKASKDSDKDNFQACAKSTRQQARARIRGVQ